MDLVTESIRTRSGQKPPSTRSKRVPAPQTTITIAGRSVQPGEKCRIEVPIASLPTQTAVTMPVVVINGVRPGPHLWVSAAIHGDEMNGIEIARRLIESIVPVDLAGILIIVPIVNVFGFINESRYLPDRRDLNRSFPGSTRGSLASRLAHLFMREIVAHCDYGIDLHTAGLSHDNLPQIRADLDDPVTRRCAEVFAAPATVHARIRDGSLREAAVKRGIKVLLYEAGEPLKFNKRAIEYGWRGVRNVLEHLGMLEKTPEDQDANKPSRPTKTALLRSTHWVRARHSGIVRLEVELGQSVALGDTLAWVSDAFGANTHAITAPAAGVVIGLATNPLLNQGSALIHIGTTAKTPTRPRRTPKGPPASAR